MVCRTHQDAAIWRLAHAQHGVVARWQLLALGLSRRAIQHRLATGRLHLLPFRGVYAVGWPEPTQLGWWMAAVLSCGDGAVLSHESAASLWVIRRSGRIPVHVSVPGASRSRGDLVVHRRAEMPETTSAKGVPVTTPFATLLDIAPDLRERELEAAINEADKLGILRADELGSLVAAVPGRKGVAAIRKVLDAGAFSGTDSDLERRFLKLVKRAGFPVPETQAWVDGFRVDFWWPGLRLVVETDGLTYHRTPMQQARDRVRDQIHAAAGVTTLRFTRAQVCYETAHVTATLRAVIARLR